MAVTHVLAFDNGHTAIHDPVPSTSGAWVEFGEGTPPHSLERDVQRKLLNTPGVNFPSLQVRRLPDGVCLTGVVELPEGKDPGLASLVSQVAGVTRVLNHLVVKAAPGSER